MSQGRLSPIPKVCLFDFYLAGESLNCAGIDNAGPQEIILVVPKEPNFQGYEPPFIHKSTTPCDYVHALAVYLVLGTFRLHSNP